jgi:hypothetical protein
MFKVVRMGLDGADRRPIVEDNLHWPNGIAVDQILDRVYWSDAHFDVLESIKIDGTDRRVILKDVDKHPFGLAVFEVRPSQCSINLFDILLFIEIFLFLMKVLGRYCRFLLLV